MHVCLNSLKFLISELQDWIHALLGTKVKVDFFHSIAKLMYCSQLNDVNSHQQNIYLPDFSLTFCPSQCRYCQFWFWFI